MASARDLTRGDGDKAASWRGFGRGRREQMQFCFRTFTVPPVQPNSVNRPSGGTCVPAAGAAQGSGPLRCSLNFPWACALPGFRLACAENTPSRSRTRQACATPASRARALGSRTHLPRGAGPQGAGLPPSPLRVCARPSRHRPRTARGCEAATAPSSWRQPGEVGPVQEGPARRRARVSPSRVPKSCSSKGNDGLLPAASGAGPKHRLRDGARARLCRETHPALHLSTLAGGAETPARPRFRAGHRRRHLDCAETGKTARGEKTERIRFHCVNCRQVAKPDLCP